MRLPQLILPLWTLLSAGLLWMFWPPQTASLERLIPEDIVALAVLTNPPEDLDFLAETRLAGWIDGGLGDLDFGLSRSGMKELASTLGNEVQRVWLVVHGLQNRGGGRWRLNLTAFLVPRAAKSRDLERTIDVTVREVFGPDRTAVQEGGDVRIYRGGEPGQVVYQIRTGNFLMVSNTREGWQEILTTSVGRKASLEEVTAFQKVSSRLPVGEGLFLYVRAGRLFSILPEFGYSLRWGPRGVRERVVEVMAGDRIGPLRPNPIPRFGAAGEPSPPGSP